MIKLKFYFDFYDYRSYLLAHQLQELQELPVEITWIPMDAYSLRALSGDNHAPTSENAKRYLQEQAERFARLHKIPFSWRSQNTSSALPLRAAYSLMKQGIQIGEFAQVLLQTIWQSSRTLESEDITQALRTLPLDSDPLLAPADPSFEWQDLHLKRAIGEGVFDLPTLIAEDLRFWGYEAFSTFKFAILERILKKSNPDLLYELLAMHLMSLQKSERQDWLQKLVNNETEEKTSSPCIAQIPFSRQIPCPPTNWLLPTNKVDSSLQFQCTNNINEAIQWCFSLGVLQLRDLPQSQLQVTIHWRKHQPQEKDIHCLFTFTTQNGLNQAWMALSENQNKPKTEFLDLDTPEAPLINLGNWKIALFSGDQAADIQRARLAAASGANLLLYLQEIKPLNAAATAILTQRWVLALGEPANLTTPDGYTQAILPKNYELSPTAQSCEEALPWIPEPPRTVLLTQEGVMIGKLEKGGLLDFQCSGKSLLVKAPRQQNLLSGERCFERMSLDSSSIWLIPLRETQILIPERVHHKLLDAFSRVPPDARLIFVNHWATLEPERLENLRPPLAILEDIWHIPIIVVAGNENLEVWTCSDFGTPYRIEKNNDLFALDIADIPPAHNCLSEALQRMQTSYEQLCGYIKSIANNK